MNIKILALLATIVILTLAANYFKIKVKTKPKKSSKSIRKGKKKVKAGLEENILQFNSEEIQEPMLSKAEDDHQKNFYVYSDSSNVYYTHNPDHESELETVEEWRRNESVTIEDNSLLELVEIRNDSISDHSTEEKEEQDYEAELEIDSNDKEEIEELDEEKGEIERCQVLRSCRWVTQAGGKKTLDCHDELICLM